MIREYAKEQQNTNLSSYGYLVLPDLGPNLGEAYGRGKYAGGSTRKLLGV